jgi:3-hydroxyacyl-CoA dehydrogenase
MAGPVTFSKRGQVGVIQVDNPPVNALSTAVRKGLLDGFRQGEADGAVKAMVVIGAGRTFIAGADIREFGKPLAEPTLHEVNAAYEASGKYMVAAIHGTALGGGLEVCLCCHYRIAAPKAQVGLPEVKLGLLPGAGGTQRLPRLVGAEAALDLIVNGRFVAAPRAKQMGIVDEVIEGDLLDGAVAFAEKLVRENAPLKKVRDKSVTADPKLFADWRKSIERTARGFLAPWRCIDCVEIACTTAMDEGLRRERELFREVHDSPQSKAQRYVFFGEREVAKIPDVPKETPVQPVRKGAVIGAGTMGGGIAMNFANAGIPVTVVEANEEALKRGLEIVRGNYAATVAKGRLGQAAMDERMALITPSTDYGAIADADFVIEAVFEEMDVKKEVFARLDKAAKPEAILASNTSTLDIDAIAAATGRPGQVVGTHFFSPANVMRLLENVRGAKTSKETIAAAMELGKRMGKIAVLVGNCDGFVGNRMLHGYLREASFLLEEGASPSQVDKVIYDFGFAMGPFTMSDMAGLDVGWRIRKRQLKEQGPTNERYSGTVADRICERGRYGQKTGAGYYRYAKGDRTPIPDPEVEALILEVARERGVQRRAVPDGEILKRCMYALVNEGARILEEGIALRPVDIDIIYVAGYGFPPYRGGPMFWADEQGLKTVLADLRRFHSEHGEFWQPAPLLERLAEEGKSFRDLPAPA